MGYCFWGGRVHPRGCPNHMVADFVVWTHFCDVFIALLISKIREKTTKLNTATWWKFESAAMSAKTWGCLFLVQKPTLGCKLYQLSVTVSIFFSTFFSSFRETDHVPELQETVDRTECQAAGLWRGHATGVTCTTQVFQDQPYQLSPVCKIW